MSFSKVESTNLPSLPALKTIQHPEYYTVGRKRYRRWIIEIWTHAAFGDLPDNTMNQDYTRQYHTEDGSGVLIRILPFCCKTSNAW